MHHEATVQPISLAQFIAQMGDEQAAILFDEKLRTVAGWRRGERYPARRKLSKIIARSRGQITWDSLLNPEAPCH